ncbi:DoxX family membrane protein [Chryseobacterium sp. G0162]|uniref:DoxX family membrane protein n=1 Tax=Chryseobacterium sp. G0162 TaxID=2487063 RepID=UPI000F4D2C4E|nr:DoxX family membrane protein [Chryseobacterium sp. G0162]AZB10395.1 DoxX family membrane protein [Chryseobacterium sp. G0162]
MKTRQDIAVFLLRMALAAGFLSAVASRLNFWGAQSSGWRNFVNYTAEVNSFFPSSWSPTLALVSTATELIIGILILTGYQIRKAALSASVLTFVFAIAMSISFGSKEALDYSVFVFSAGAFLLSSFPCYQWSLDQLLHQ